MALSGKIHRIHWLTCSLTCCNLPSHYAYIHTACCNHACCNHMAHVHSTVYHHDVQFVRNEPPPWLPAVHCMCIAGAAHTNQDASSAQHPVAVGCVGVQQHNDSHIHMRAVRTNAPHVHGQCSTAHIRKHVLHMSHQQSALSKCTADDSHSTCAQSEETICWHAPQCHPV